MTRDQIQYRPLLNKLRKMPAVSHMPQQLYAEPPLPSAGASGHMKRIRPIVARATYIRYYLCLLK